MFDSTSAQANIVI